MQTIEAVGNHVIFQFVEKALMGRFVNEAHSGLLISSEDTSQTLYPRWAKATHVGPDVNGVEVGDYILIEGGKWTTGFMVGGDRYWKTDDTVIILASDEPGTTY